MTIADAPARLLDAAGPLFAEHGYDAVSVRAVNKAAGMNPAAVHYHFGSKEALATALLERRLGDLWSGRLAELEGLLTGSAPVPAARIAALLVEPLAALAHDPERRWLGRLLAKIVRSGHPLPWHSAWSYPEPWAALLARAVPGLPPEEAALRWRLARDLVLHTYGDSDGTPPPAASVTAFVAAGLTAPFPPPDGAPPCQKQSSPPPD
ncbi:helix-turn-helix domain-containing protein [Actinocorallia sp. A-T 12471]|uniref:TetR/AcrR family transcriptional regulator n=1 Tax=Actinocorallia sp. A-T 12471 TaxID=3089813 RepID=UPI0029CFEA74|nr:helix-turn-helix domain-containing protein [Actinocorallia sp. A-T 12471]MDX6741315.1 helix-turn-helix domain-containing protein [Actinocorallia sp. A-T 12471]